MRIVRTEVFRYGVPLRAPLTLGGEVVRRREGLLLRIESDTGASGWGEAAPLPGFSSETCEEAETVLRRCAKRLAGMEVPEDYRYFEGAEIARSDDMASVGFAVESAWFSMMADAARQPLHHYLNPAAPNRVQVQALLSGPEEYVLAQADEAARNGFHAAKLKVGGDDPEAMARLARRVRLALPSPIVLRVDANRAWDLEQALAFSRAASDCEIQYIEEPLLDPFDFGDYLEGGGLPFALDETLHSFHHRIRASFNQDSVASPAFEAHVRQLLAVFRTAFAVVWKPSFIYLPNMGDDIRHGRFALPVGRLVLSAAYESGVGMGVLAAFAAAYCRHDEPVGLDTYGWLASDVLQERLSITNGEIDLMATEGLARGVDHDALDLVELFTV